MKNPIALLRRLAFWEAISFLVLLGVAMPLKYLAGMPMAVKAFGWAHGVLFISLCAVLLQTMCTARWPLGRGALIFAAALIPFGPFLVDRRLEGFEQEFLRRG